MLHLLIKAVKHGINLPFRLPGRWTRAFTTRAASRALCAVTYILWQAVESTICGFGGDQPNPLDAIALLL